MTEAVKTYMAKNKPKKSKSKMAEWKEELSALASEGYTLSQMQDFLKSCGVKANESEIWKFINRQQKRAEKQTVISTISKKDDAAVKAARYNKLLGLDNE